VTTAQVDVAAEAEAKRAAALEAAARVGARAFVASAPPNVRWLLCGRGRPVDAAGAESPYTVVVTAERASVLFADIEAPRVADEERFEELGFEAVPYPWFEGRERAMSAILDGVRAAGDAEVEDAIRPSRMRLVEPEFQRYRAAGAATAAAMADTLPSLRSGQTELEAAAELAHQARRHDLFPRVVLVAGERRQKVHRHPLPTEETLDRHALLAITAEREGLHVSLTRLVSFGPVPGALALLARSTAEVDAAMLAASRPGAATGEVFETAAREYEAQGFPEEWRYHHQGGPTGYRGREVFAVPGEPTTLPDGCAVAWNPSITGGGKSEDTALVSAAGIEVITRTPELGELETAGLPRPAIVEL
jgi:Xaa-Pro aminopeptidase